MKAQRFSRRFHCRNHSVNLVKFRIRRLLLMGAWFGALALAGCEKAEDARNATPPVVRQAPVETHPFEDGYNAGYALGLSQATRGAKIPKPADVEPLAREQAGEAPERTERWQRGFVEGYLDGFRKVVTGQK
jgi:hypothetical protein